jgi:hypothetical protein
MPLIRAKQVQKLLALGSVQRVYALAREGIIPSIRLGRSIRFDPAQIAAFIANGGKALNGPGGWRRPAPVSPSAPSKGV